MYNRSWHDSNAIYVYKIIFVYYFCYIFLLAHGTTTPHFPRTNFWMMEAMVPSISATRVWVCILYLLGLAAAVKYTILQYMRVIFFQKKRQSVRRPQQGRRSGAWDKRSKVDVVRYFVAGLKKSETNPSSAVLKN